MRKIVSSIKIVQKILGQQKVEEGTPYRLNTHYLRVERPEGVLLYHTLTGELLLLSAEEAAALGELPGPLSPELCEPAARWFLRPLEAEHKDCAACPRCVRIKKCPNTLEHCTPIKRAYNEEKLHRSILGAYEEWKVCRPAPEDTV